jgi:phosphate transport system permease protein
MTQETLQTIRANISQRKLRDRAFVILGLLVVLFAVLTLFSLILKLLIEGIPRLSPDFFLSFPSRRPGSAGILSAWVGTSLIMLVTAVAAIPLGIASAIYLEEYARKNWLADLIEINVTNLAGVPSIIYGLLALGLFVNNFNLGESILTAGCTLALLILPIVIVTTREALRAVPISIREAACALGASKWQAIWDHILPCSIGSILTGIVIGLSRAIGETAPLITIGALTFIAFLPEFSFKATFPFMTWLEAPFTVMPIQMFNWVSRPDPAFQTNAAAAGTVLIAMTLAMNGFAIYLRYRFRRGIKW